MARTKKISNEQILVAARKMFDAHGFSATTSQIAEAAGISEGSIFRRWSSKDDLLIAALGVQRPPWVDGLEALSEDEERPVAEQLEWLGLQMLDFFREHIPKMTAVLACGMAMRQKFMRSDNAPPVVGVRAVTEYFANLRKQGRIRFTDPEVAARMFVAAMVHYAMADIGGLNDLMPMPRETYVRGVVDNLLRGIASDDVEAINE